MEYILTLTPLAPYVILFIGFFFLIKGADMFVDGCSAIAAIFHIPSIIIGLTIAALGTSAPEAAVSITSSIKGANAMAVSNVIGSNIFNLLVVIGLCSVVKPLLVSSTIIKRDYPICIAVTIFMLLLCVDFFTDKLNPGKISRADGIILLVLFAAYTALLIHDTLKERKAGNTGMEESAARLSAWKSTLYIIIGALAIAAGGEFVVDSATAIAESFNLSATLIGLTIVALGTSLPELVTSIVAACKGENDMAVGNVVGSNMFNILFVLGGAAAISPINLATVTNPLFTVYDMIILFVFTIIVYIFILLRKDVSRLEGAFMFFMYLGYLAYIIMR